jgi:ubiquinone/menaquinone biosynthesis C-methylase UbiE
MNLRTHWETLYATKPAARLGWYRQHLDTSLRLIDSLNLPAHASIVDVGCGVSTLADDLLERGFRTLTLLDISESALRTVEQRLSCKRHAIRFRVGDVLQMEFQEGEFMLWHDRAVFHFLTLPDQRMRYTEQLTRSLQPGGYAILAAFSHEAPPTCSGLPVQRYNAEELHQTLGEPFNLLHQCDEVHTTPGGTVQKYIYTLFQRTV